MRGEGRGKTSEPKTSVLPDGEALLAKFLRERNFCCQRSLLRHGIQMREKVGQQYFSKSLCVPVSFVTGLVVCEAFFWRQTGRADVDT